MAEKFSPQTEQQQQSVMELEQRHTDLAVDIGVMAVSQSVDERRPMTDDEMRARRQELMSDNFHLPELDGLYSEFKEPREERLTGHFVW